MIEAPDIEGIPVIMGDEAGFNGKNGRIYVGPPERGRSTGWTVWRFAENVIPRAGRRRSCQRTRSHRSPVPTAGIVKQARVIWPRRQRKTNCGGGIPMP